MEWYVLVLAASALSLPLAWLIRSMHQVWVRANMPAFWSWIMQNRRRDCVIKETRERVEKIEQFLEEVGEWSERTDVEMNHLHGRAQGLERSLAVLRQKIRSRGIITDA